MKIYILSEMNDAELAKFSRKLDKMNLPTEREVRKGRPDRFWKGNVCWQRERD